MLLLVASGWALPISGSKFKVTKGGELSINFYKHLVRNQNLLIAHLVIADLARNQNPFDFAHTLEIPYPLTLCI